MKHNVWIYSAGLAGLGLVCFGFMSFAMQWQPVPGDLANWTGAILLSASSLLIAAILLLFPRTSQLGGWLSGFIFLLWVAALHLPRVLAEPSSVVAWLGVAEILALGLGGFVWALTQEGREGRPLRILTAAFGLCALVWGLAHFVYAEFTAMLVPAWLPGQLFWAYATGVGHSLAGLALISGIKARLAAGLLAAMCGSFVLLVHLPRLAAHPGSQSEWTGLMIATLICGAAWIIRSGLTARVPQTHPTQRGEILAG